MPVPGRVGPGGEPDKVRPGPGGLLTGVAGVEVDVTGKPFPGAPDATAVVAERGEAGIENVHELTRGDGTHTVLECVGHRPAYDQAHCHSQGRPAPVRAYIERLLPGVLGGTVNPGKVFDRTISSNEVPEGTVRWIPASP